MKNNQDEIKKKMYEKEREYLPGTTVAQVRVEVSLHRAYIDLKNKSKIFELIDIYSERFDARIRADDAYDARDITIENITKSCENWEMLPSDLNIENQTEEEDESNKNEQ